MLSGKKRAFQRKFVSTLLAILTLVSLGPPKAVATVADHLVISEVQTGRTGTATNDFIELYNPTPNAINLKGFRLVRRSQAAIVDSTIKSWTTDTLIPAYGFYLWANSAYSAIAVAPDTMTTATIADNNSIALRQGAENTGEIIDSLAWGFGHSASLGEGSATQNISPDNSLERKANALSTQSTMAAGGIDELKGNAWDTDDNPADFIVRDNPQSQNSLSPAENPLDTQNILINNSSFEDDLDSNGLPDFWKAYNFSASDGRSFEYSLDSASSLRITGDTDKSKYVKQTIQAAGKAGDTLLLSAWNKTVGSSTGGGVIGAVIHLNNADGMKTIKMMFFEKNTHDWQNSTTSITANKDYSSIDIAVGYVRQTGTAYFDNLMLTKSK